MACPTVQFIPGQDTSIRIERAMPTTSPSLYLVRSGPLLRFWGLFRQACVAAYEDNCFGVAKGAAYSSLLAFFPVLASITAILAQVKADAVAGSVMRPVFAVVSAGRSETG